MDNLRSSEVRPLLVIEPPRGIVALKLADLWAYRELLYFLAWRDVKVWYKQTVLGAAWAIIQLLFSMVVFSIVLGKLGKFLRTVSHCSNFCLTSVADVADAFAKAAESYKRRCDLYPQGSSKVDCKPAVTRKNYASAWLVFRGELGWRTAVGQ